MSPLDQHLQNIPEDNRPFYLRPDDQIRHSMTLVKRFHDEDDPEKYHYEAWARRNEESDDPDCLVLYLSQKLDPRTIEDSWKYFKRLWKDPNYRKNQLKGETIH